ncbi:putative RNA-binding Zn ribbon-like protein [Clostridium punense]|uniref:RNA-binding Zn ribbon-like protein n=1 Tax=Clostridium punense TaxID=1054297 RepID=A0ABS4K2W3_9CLOT|nr:MULTISPECIES: CGNR zinc finger domain-containing protein [Clostridium]MBP2022124.1 putative RNA-binding Zn ribbon-like protein [Clostridium punense]
MLDLICFDFINSKWYKEQDGIEPFTKQEWVNKFLITWNLATLPIAEQEDLNELINLRDLLVSIVEHIQERGSISREHIVELNNFMSKTPVYRKIQVYEKQLVLDYECSFYNWKHVINRILGSFAELICNHSIDNIKVCENSSCRFVFYDSSKNHSKRWCCDTCRNLIKVRNFRAKHKEKFK